MVKRLILADTREKETAKVKLLTFPTLPFKKATLRTGDFTLWGYTSLISVEHKRWGDYVGCVSTHGRWKKFQEGQLTRLRAFVYKMIIVTGHLGMPVPSYSSCRKGTIIQRTAIILSQFQIPVVFASNEKLGAQLIEEFLLASAKEIDIR